MFQDPEMDFGYQEYWKKFPDDSEDTQKWIDQFRRNDDQIMIVKCQLQNDPESDDEEDDISFVQYHSPERMNNKRSLPTKKLNYSALNQNAASIIKEQEDDLISVFGNSNYIYNLTNRKSASKYSYQVPIADINKEIANEYFNDLLVNKPKLIIIDINEKYINLINSMNTFLENNNYKYVKTGIYERNNKK